MSDYSGMSDRELDALVADSLDGYASLPGVFLPLYSTSFDDALRVLRAMDWATQRRAITGLGFVQAMSLGTFLIEATPRQLCVAMLEAREETP